MAQEMGRVTKTKGLPEDRIRERRRLVLEQLAQHQGDAQGRDREAEALHKEADQAEGDHHKALEDVVVDATRPSCT